MPASILPNAVVTFPLTIFDKIINFGKVSNLPLQIVSKLDDKLFVRIAYNGKACSDKYLSVGVYPCGRPTLAGNRRATARVCPYEWIFYFMKAPKLPLSPENSSVLP